MQTVKDLSIDQLRSLIAEVVEEKFRELLGDPDEGLTLRPEVRERLLKSLNLPRDSRQTTPAADVAAQLGLEW
ncbi:MAG: hypothetical protein HY525_03290 [Betaproteobacteria bacterium]|nr:hypothetical protein [Betaproteobacteria bacterium]